MVGKSLDEMEEDDRRFLLLVERNTIGRRLDNVAHNLTVAGAMQAMWRLSESTTHRGAICASEHPDDCECYEGDWRPNVDGVACFDKDGRSAL